MSSHTCPCHPRPPFVPPSITGTSRGQDTLGAAMLDGTSRDSRANAGARLGPFIEPGNRKEQLSDSQALKRELGRGGRRHTEPLILGRKDAVRSLARPAQQETPSSAGCFWMHDLLDQEKDSCFRGCQIFGAKGRLSFRKRTSTDSHSLA